jgi:hypothetical protein
MTGRARPIDRETTHRYLQRRNGTGGTATCVSVTAAIS